MSVHVPDVLAFLSDRILGTRVGHSVELTGPAALQPGSAGCISFASRRGPRMHESVANTASTLLILLPEYLDFAPDNSSAVAVADPRLEFARVLQRFFTKPRVPGVHPTAVIATSAVLGAVPTIGAGVVIGEACRVGDRVVVGPNAVLGDGCVLGDDVSIGPGTVLGFAGFGYARERDGTPLLLPHSGAVRIGDRVEIGANAAIDRGTIEDTVIEDDVKIDNLVHIAHNCRIRRGAFVIATAILCGGVDVGEEAWIAPNSAVREQVTIGQRAVVGLSATVINDVDADDIVVGSPAKSRLGEPDR